MFSVDTFSLLSDSRLSFLATFLEGEKGVGRMRSSVRVSCPATGGGLSGLLRTLGLNNTTGSTFPGRPSIDYVGMSCADGLTSRVVGTGLGRRNNRMAMCATEKLPYRVCTRPSKAAFADSGLPVGPTCSCAIFSIVISLLCERNNDTGGKGNEGYGLKRTNYRRGAIIKAMTLREKQGANSSIFSPMFILTTILR